MDKRFIAGLLVTCLWLVLFLFMMFWPGDKMALREINLWGDTFAGFFAPLAFLWLVLGYMQQGDELRLTRQTLNLQARELENSVKAQLQQAEELKNSGEQQRQLVEVYRRMLQAQVEAMESQQRQIRQAQQPRFVFNVEGFTQRNGLEIWWGFRMINLGRTATNLTFTFDPSPKHTSLGAMDSFIENTERSHELTLLMIPEVLTLKISYTDVDNEIQHQEFSVTAEGGEQPKLSFYRTT